MKKWVLFLSLLLLFMTSIAQRVNQRVAAAYKIFESDSQMKSAIASLYVIDAKSGKVVFEKNAFTGLAPASTQKIITAATAYELLGKDFRYKTEFGYYAKKDNNKVTDVLYLNGSGDPSLGSWRWPQTNENLLMERVVGAIKKSGITTVIGNAAVINDWDDETIPDGWIWQDIGNYYGAGASRLNFRENQFDVLLSSGDKIGDPVQITGYLPDYDFKIKSLLSTAAKGTGDNAYIYYPLQSTEGVIRGTIPAGEKKFVISGSVPNPFELFLTMLRKKLSADNLLRDFFHTGDDNILSSDSNSLRIVHTEYSPVLDSLIYWFNRRSINLYGEAFVKTIGYKLVGKGHTDEGVKLVRNHWKEKGIGMTELRMVDGSGLSPLNRVTTHAQVRILQYAQKQEWYDGFYRSIPEFNGMKMKSGTINGVKGFCGYHRSADGSEYIFSFLVNNYNGSASSLVQKMYKVLDQLK